MYDRERYHNKIKMNYLSIAVKVTDQQKKSIDDACNRMRIGRAELVRRLLKKEGIIKTDFAMRNYTPSIADSRS